MTPEEITKAIQDLADALHRIADALEKALDKDEDDGKMPTS
jgi:hypothetical protein